MITRLLYSSRPANPANIRPKPIKNISADSTLKTPQNDVTNPDVDDIDCTSSQDIDSPVYAPNGFMALKNLLNRCSKRFCFRVLLGLWITYVIRILVNSSRKVYH